jgi:oligosaccharyltransferase complex subunit beta
LTSLKGSLNKEFIFEVLKWTFQQKSVIKVESHHHAKIGNTTQQSWYRIKDVIDYSIKLSTLSKYDQEKNKYVFLPYTDSEDVQLELTMLDPYYRLNLKHVGNGVYSVKNVKLPDHYGVFTFQVRHQILGLSFFDVSEKVILKPFRHDEYERFIVTAYPYYFNVFSLMVGFLLLTLVLIFNGDKTKSD